MPGFLKNFILCNGRRSCLNDPLCYSFKMRQTDSFLCGCQAWRIKVFKDHYRLNNDYWKWKDTDRHPSSICGFSLTLTWIVSYIKSWQNAAPTLSAVGLSSQGAQTADGDIILRRNACRAKLHRKVQPPYQDVRWEERLTGSFWLNIIPEHHSGLKDQGQNSYDIICLVKRQATHPFVEVCSIVSLFCSSRGLHKLSL